MTTTDTLSAGNPSTEVPGRVSGDRHPFPPVFLVAFLVLLNAVAMYGQAGWFREHITNHNGPEDWIPAIGVALVVELVGVFLAGMAHATQMANQSAGTLRMGSYAVGLLVGALNFAHFSANLATAITFGALSATSPWLWAIYSRYMHRDKLVELGLIDARGVKLSINRKFWHPIKSIRVMSYAAWAGTTDPEVAVRAWESRNEVPTPEVQKLLTNSSTGRFRIPGSGTWNGMPELAALALSDAPVSPAPGMSGSGGAL
jgi:hypothetical protein